MNLCLCLCATLCFESIRRFFKSDVSSRSGVGGPVVGDLTGEYHYDHKKSVLNWQLPVIDASNSQGSLEFTISGHPDDFYPINVSFYSPKTMCNIHVSFCLNSSAR